MRIAIIGGGIGGLTAALALRQLGFAPEVFEQAPALLEVGAAIIMWPNAMRVLHRLGLGEVIGQHGGVVEQARWLRHDGRLLNNIRLPESDVPAIALHRAELQNVLLQALPQDSLHLGHVFETCEHLPDKLVAHFSGGPAFDCDLLIGADGIHSRARAELLNDGLPIDRGYIAWRGVVSHAPASLTPATAFEIYGNGQRFGIGPIGSGRVGWWATANKTSGHIDSADAEANRQELLRLFDGWCEPVLELIRATALTSLVRNAVHDRAPVKKWGAGSMTLLGDAIHPTTPNLGQGGCMAIEDAAVLARCLKNYSSETDEFEAGEKLSPVSIALRKFEQLRFGRTTAIARYSRLYGEVGQWENRWAVMLREMILSLVPAVLSKRLLSEVFDYDACGVRV